MKRKNILAGLLLLAVLIPLSAAAENLLRDASFEAGAGPLAWEVIGLDAGGPIGRANLDTSTAVHGRTSLKLPLLARPLFSGPVRIPAAGDYVFSVQLKASQPVQVQLMAESEKSAGAIQSGTMYGQARFNVTAEWQRFDLKVKLPKEIVNVRITPLSAAAGGHLWVDAAALTAGESPQPFSPRRPLEAGLTCEVPAKVFYPGEAGAVELWVANHTAGQETPRFRYTVTDIYDRKGPEAVVEIGPVAANGFKTVPIRVDTGRRGLFSLQGQLDRPDAEPVEIVYSVLVKPAGRTILGAHATISPTGLAALKRGGVSSVEALTDTLHRLSYLRPAPDRFGWFDEKADWLEQSGLEGIGNLQYFNAEGDFSWAYDTPKKVDPPVAMRGRVVDEVTYLKDDIWRDHVREVVGHYRKAYRRWVVDDEVSGGNTAFMYLEVLRSAREAARSVDPEIKVSTSADGPWFEELIELGGRDVFDAVGGSVGGVPYWHALKLGRLKEMYNKENWVTGIFATANTFYRLNRPRDDWAGQAAAIYRQMVRCFFLQRADTVAPYIFRYNSFSATRSPDYSFFDFDGSFKAQAIGFLMAGNIFSALTPDPEPVYYPFLEYDSCVVYGFNKAGRRGYLLTGNGQRLKLDLPKSGLEILDWFENPVEPAALEGGPQEVILTLSGQPVYLYDRGAGPQRLDEAVRGAQLLPPVDGLLTGPLFLVRDGQLVRAIVTANLDSQPRSGLAAGAGRLDSSAPQANPFLTRPLENEKGAWLLNCLKTARPVRLDGNLPEWSDRSSAWMYVDWGENSPPTRRQLHILSGGHFINHRPWHDFKVGFSAGYDAENLYFAFQINDDDIAPPEQAGRGLYDGLRLRLDTRPVEDLGRAAEDEDDYLVEVKLPAPDRVNAELVSQGRRQPVTAAVGRHAHGWTVELAVPLKTLGISGSPVGRLLGLNLVASDADYNRKYQGPDQYRPEFSELIWAADNPFRLGSLYFAE